MLLCYIFIKSASYCSWKNKFSAEGCETRHACGAYKSLSEVSSNPVRVAQNQEHYPIGSEGSC